VIATYKGHNCPGLQYNQPYTIEVYYLPDNKVLVDTNVSPFVVYTYTSVHEFFQEWILTEVDITFKRE